MSINPESGPQHEAEDYIGDADVLAKNPERNFQFNSLEDVIKFAKLDTKFKEIATSFGGDFLRSEKKGDREWIFKDEHGKESSVSGATKGTAIEERSQLVLNELYDRGYSISEHVKDENVLIREIYFTDSSGKISFKIYESSLELIDTASLYREWEDGMDDDDYILKRSSPAETSSEENNFFLTQTSPTLVTEQAQSNFDIFWQELFSETSEVEEGQTDQLGKPEQLELLTLFNFQKLEIPEEEQETLVELPSQDLSLPGVSMLAGQTTPAFEPRLSTVDPAIISIQTNIEDFRETRVTEPETPDINSKLALGETFINLSSSSEALSAENSGFESRQPETSNSGEPVTAERFISFSSVEDRSNEPAMELVEQAAEENSYQQGTMLETVKAVTSETSKIDLISLPDEANKTEEIQKLESIKAPKYDQVLTADAKHYELDPLDPPSYIENGLDQISEKLMQAPQLKGELPIISIINQEQSRITEDLGQDKTVKAVRPVIRIANSETVVRLEQPTVLKEQTTEKTFEVGTNLEAVAISPATLEFTIPATVQNSEKQEQTQNYQDVSTNLAMLEKAASLIQTPAIVGSTASPFKERAKPLVTPSKEQREIQAQLIEYSKEQDLKKENPNIAEQIVTAAKQAVELPIEKAVKTIEPKENIRETVRESNPAKSQKGIERRQNRQLQYERAKSTQIVQRQEKVETLVRNIAQLRERISHLQKTAKKEQGPAKLQQNQGLEKRSKIDIIVKLVRQTKTIQKPRQRTTRPKSISRASLEIQRARRYRASMANGIVNTNPTMDDNKLVSLKMAA